MTNGEYAIAAYLFAIKRAEHDGNMTGVYVYSRMLARYYFRHRVARPLYDAFRSVYQNGSRCIPIDWAIETARIGKPQQPPVGRWSAR